MTMLRWRVTTGQMGPDGTHLTPGMEIDAPDDDPVVQERALAGMLMLLTPLPPARKRATVDEPSAAE